MGESTTNNTTDKNEALCANCGDAIHRCQDATHDHARHWYHVKTGNARCAVRFAEPSRASGAAVEGDARTERLEAQLDGVMNSLAASQREVERLRAGRFTPEEFQNLCHGFDESDKEAFVAGCLEYQQKLFGCAAVSSPLPAEPPPHDSCSHWREGDSDNCFWCGDDLGPTTEADVAAPAEPRQEGEQEKQK